MVLPTGVNCDGLAVYVLDLVRAALCNHLRLSGAMYAQMYAQLSGGDASVFTLLAANAVIRE